MLGALPGLQVLCRLVLHCCGLAPPAVGPSALAACAHCCAMVWGLTWCPMRWDGTIEPHGISGTARMLLQDEQTLCHMITIFGPYCLPAGLMMMARTKDPWPSN